MTKVLIVDDSPTIRRMVKASLQTLPGLVFAEAGNGLEAIEQLALAPVALVVLDLNMPDIHGLDVLKFMRGQRSLTAIPVVVLTTRDDEASRDAAMGAGATEYLTKPFTPDVLLSSVRASLAKSPPTVATR